MKPTAIPKKLKWSEVLLTSDAVCDLQELYEYLAQHDAPGKAEHVLTKIEKAFDGLSESPDHGAYPKELLTLGICDYREVFFKPYRVIYRVVDDVVHDFRKPAVFIS